MKTFITYDFYSQSVLALLLLLFMLPLSAESLAIAVYFLIAVNHLISANRKMFSGTYKKSILFRIYYTISMLFIMTLFSRAAAGEIYIIDRFWIVYGRYVMGFAIGGTPILALIYYLICLNDFWKQIKKEGIRDRTGFKI